MHGWVISINRMRLDHEREREKVGKRSVEADERQRSSLAAPLGVDIQNSSRTLKLLMPVGDGGYVRVSLMERERNTTCVTPRYSLRQSRNDPSSVAFGTLNLLPPLISSSFLLLQKKFLRVTSTKIMAPSTLHVPMNKMEENGRLSNRIAFRSSIE